MLLPLVVCLTVMPICGLVYRTILSSASLAPDIKLQAHVVNDCFEYRIKTDSDYSHHFLQSQMDLMNTNHAK
jgi:hypothetical protein